MARENFLRWDAGSVTATAPNTEGGTWLTAQVDTYGDAGGQPMLQHAPYGMMGRPLDPETGDDDSLLAACQAIYCYEGDQGHVLPTLDTRVLEKLPALKKGGSVQYDSSGSFGVFDPEEHTHTQYVPVEFDGDGKPTKAHTITVGKASDGTALLSLVHANGLSILMQDDDKHSLIIKNKDGSASWVLADDGHVFAGPVRLAGGLVVGDAASVPLARSAELLAWVTAANAAIIAWTGLAAAAVAKLGGQLPPLPSLPALPTSVASTAANG